MRIAVDGAQRRNLMQKQELKARLFGLMVLRMGGGGKEDMKRKEANRYDRRGASEALIPPPLDVLL